MARGRVTKLAWVLTAAASMAVWPARAAEAPEEKVKWTRGPADVDLGSNVAEVKLGDKLLFADEADTRRLLREMGNPPNGTEMGLVTSTVEGESWFMVFEWRAVGLVKDDGDEIDADALLKSLQRSTEASNEERKKQGSPALHVVGWAEAPQYDRATHNLTWAIRGKDDAGGEVVNYNVRLLGREGVMSVTLVDDPAGLTAAKPRVDAVIQNFKFKRGRTYAEWVPGDKVAAYGLTALVAAGAGAAAVKTGLFAMLGGLIAKAWKAVVVAVIAVGAGIVKIVRGAFGRNTPVAKPGTFDDRRP